MEQIIDLASAIPKQWERYAIVAGDYQQFKFLLNLYYRKTGLNFKEQFQYIRNAHDLDGGGFAKCLFYGTWYRRDDENKYRIMAVLEHFKTPCFEYREA